jgi:hypothetical protein
LARKDGLRLRSQGNGVRPGGVVGLLKGYGFVGAKRERMRFASGREGAPDAGKTRGESESETVGRKGKWSVGSFARLLGRRLGAARVKVELEARADGRDWIRREEFWNTNRQTNCRPNPRRPESGTMFRLSRIRLPASAWIWLPMSVPKSMFHSYAHRSRLTCRTYDR